MSKYSSYLSLGMKKIIMWCFGAVLFLPLIVGVCIRVSEIVAVERAIAPTETAVNNYLRYEMAVIEKDDLRWPMKRLIDDLYPEELHEAVWFASSHFPSAIRLPFFGRIGWNIWSKHDVWMAEILQVSNDLLQAIEAEAYPAGRGSLTENTPRESAMVLSALLRYSPSRGIFAVSHRKSTCILLAVGTILAFFGFKMVRHAHRMPGFSENIRRRNFTVNHGAVEGVESPLSPPLDWGKATPEEMVRRNYAAYYGVTSMN